jgi:TonB family protein
MDALSRWVATFFLNSLWQVTLVAGAATVADLSLRRAPARYRHALWAMALAAAVALPVASLRTLQSRRPTPVPLAIEVSAPAPAFAQVPALPPAHASAYGSRVGLMLPAFLAGIHYNVSLPRWLARAILVLYLSFLASMMVRFGRAWLRTRATRRVAFAEPLPAHVASTLERCLRAMARRCSLNRTVRKKALTVRAWWSREIPGPVTVGVRRCTIILPLSLRDPDAVEDMTAAVAHETAHVVRRDYLWNLVAELLSLPVAFHPLILLMKRRLGETRELACDELAARVLNPPDYARSLVRQANQILRRAVATKLDYTMGVFDANILEERVMRLLKPRASGRLAKICLLLGLFVISALCLAAARFSVGVAQAKPRSSGLSQNHQPDEVLFEKGTNEIRNGRYDAGRLMLQTLINSYPDSEYLAKARLAIADSYNQESGVSNASVSGIVVDISGARVPNARVLLINRDSVARQEVSTDATGNFAFKNLSPGRYSLEVESKGMGRASRLFELKASGPAPFIPFVLEPGIMTESVVVTAKAPHGVSTNGAAAVGPRRIRVGGNVEAAQLIDNPPPEYPESARAKAIQGVVLLEGVISIDGVPMSLKVVSSPNDDLSKAATDAVSRWRYRSTLLNGDPVEVLTTIAVAFRLEE